MGVKRYHIRGKKVSYPGYTGIISGYDPCEIGLVRRYWYYGIRFVWGRWYGDVYTTRRILIIIRKHIMNHWERVYVGMRVRGYEGSESTRVRGYEGTRVQRYNGTRVRG